MILIMLFPLSVVMILMLIIVLSVAKIDLCASH